MIDTKKYLNGLLALMLGMILWSCVEDGPDTPAVQANYYVGIEAATDPASDVLAIASSLDEGVISPVNNGFEQPVWMTFLQGKNKIIATGYTSAPEFIAYELIDGQLAKGESFFLDEQTYAYDFVDENTLLITSSPRAGFSAKKIFVVDLQSMAIARTVSTTFGDIEADSLLAFPTDMKVRDDKLFISYYHIHANGNFSTPSANVARVAVFSYPDLTFEKEITDERAANIGRYYSHNALEMDENGDIYTFSSSSLACGFAPVPANNSAILRIRSGETAFDDSFYIDFETLSGGYKINDLIYAGNGKAVVRVLQEEETNADYLWAAYAPTSTSPLLSTGIVDLHAGTFTLLDNVPKGGGGWNTPHLVEGNTVYLGVSNSSYAGIYKIDTQSETAVEGATVDGNYAKAILSLKE
ncbi:DUF4374 domain-containing protein [Marinoscillum furvescens]|uniref:Uncharacterized protein DUF4374 n=1 Tax=Marinoscillum furvescens DSM 4134 TaxID=1122208 RepID=A0A3D9L5R7_MARFU|nr:DUF4374 domain-containing protein [Marinoscillum furvescens]REE00444.1 uncharacterized protein DUF4374 [Marinoscillum furvescens DSM 4134]